MLPKQNYMAELAPVAAPLPREARVFVTFRAENDQQAVDTVNALAVIRADKMTQIDIYQMNGDKLGRRIWSGLHRPPRARPSLSVVA